MNRRHAVRCAPLCLPAGLLAQPAPRSARVALFVGSVPPQDGGRWPTQQALLERLRELGWTEGSNLQVVLRYGHGTSEGMARAASELAALGPDVIVAAGTQPVRALQRATTTIPIVMAGTGDPVGSGLVASLSRAGSGADAMVMLQDPFYGGGNLARATAAAIRRRLPLASTGGHAYAAAGCLLAYSHNELNVFRQAADYVDRILRGTRPGDLPIDQPTRYELILNRNTARAIGVEFPRALPLRADEVVE